MRLGSQAALVGLAGWLAGADARAGPEPARVVIVVADGLDAAALAEALALRVPEARVVPRPGCAGAQGHVRKDSSECEPACGPGCTLARLRRDGDALRIEVRRDDGRVFARAGAAEAGEPERAAAASLAHLLAAIEEGTAAPAPVEEEVTQPTIPPPPSEPAAVVLPKPREPPTASVPVVTAPPRIEIGPVFGVTEVFGVGRPSALAGWVGDGGHVGVELRGRGGLLVGLELRGLGARDGGLRLGRLRVALALGHSLRRGLFELRTRAALVIEPWWVAARSSGAPTTFGAPLIGAAVSVTPGLSAALSPRVRLFAGLRLEASFAVETRGGAIVQAVDTAGAPLFRLGGFELAAAAELGVRWGVGGRR